MDYKPRIVDRELDEQLDATGCVVLEGPKAVGKTATARRRAASEVLLDIDANARQLATIDAGLLLAGPAPRLMDEWQLAPNLWNQVRREADARGIPGQFILTGSAVPGDDAARHSGAGRMSRLRVRPMTLFETGHSTGEVSLSALLDGSPPRAGDPGLTVAGVVDRICVGGWPAVAQLDSATAQRAMRAYLDEVARTDIQRVDGVRRDPIRVQRVLRSLARNVATEVSISRISADAGEPDEPLERGTVGEYLRSLNRLMVTEDVPAWTPALRSRARLRQSGTRHFVDPCLAVAALNAAPSALLADLNTTGLLFESLVVRDVRVYLQQSGGRVLHYRDSNDLEIDLILETQDGRWAAIEVKLGVASVDAAAASLLKFSQEVDVRKAGDPAFLAVVTATGYGYRRPDGVAVIPIGALGP
jgi:predicted AAA+ superfamily ATPase